MATYVVTGGAGFIGSHLVDHLLREGHTVRVVDNFLTGKRENLQPWEKDIQIFEADIRNLSAITPAFVGADFVLHQAALPSVPRSVDDPITTNDCNIAGTLNVLLASRDAGVRRVVYAASSSAYGDQEEPVKVETLQEKPLSPYATSKLTGEHYCKNFYGVYGLETVCLRYFNVFGERQDPDSPYSAVIAKFVFEMLAGKQPMIHGDGMQSRDFTYVENNVRANLLACTAPKEACGQTMNIACGQNMNLNELVSLINEILGTSISAQYDDARKGDVRHSLAGIEKARALLRYEPHVSVQQGLERYIAWAKEQR